VAEGVERDAQVRAAIVGEQRNVVWKGGEKAYAGGKASKKKRKEPRVV
jgi:hypothetical protein